MKRRIFLAAALALFGLPAAQAEEKCQLYRVLSLDMLPEAHGVVVPAAIGEHPLKMAVDTGGYFTAFTEEMAAALDLKPYINAASGMAVYGGIPLRRFVSVSDFRLGNMKTRELDYPLLPQGFMPPGIDGLLSPDFLANYDLDFDFANGKFSLFSPDHCDGKVGWWTTSDMLTAIPIKRDGPLHISMRVNLDGKEVKALIDTGASRTIMSLDEAEDLFDLNTDALEDGPAVNNVQGTKRARFKKMSFGDVEVLNPDIILVPDRGAGGRAPDMILGINVLRQLHLYIAYREKMLYLTAASEHR